MSEEREFNFKGYWGADILRPFVEHSKKGVHYCIYCGAIADTREHVPSKVFLNKPLPSDLPTLPACRICNNGFSGDELYTNTYIKCVKSITENNNHESTMIQPVDRNEVREAKEAVKRALQEGTFSENERIKRIIKKLALGHIVYELLECYNIDSFPVSDICISYVLRCSVDEKAWSYLEAIEPLDNEALPEIGSRAFRNIYVMDLPLKEKDGSNSITKHLLFMDWTDIQNGEYRYITLYRNGDIIVKMIIRNFMYAEVKIKR